MPILSLCFQMNKVITLFSMSAPADESMHRDWSTAADPELLSLLKRGNHGALTETLRRYETPLIGFLTAQTNSRTTAEDLAQETFLKLIKRPPMVLSTRTLKPWLFRVAANLASDYRRKHNRIQSVEALPEEGDFQFQKLGSELDSEYLLSQHPHDIRIVVSLRDFGALSYREIAAQLKIPLGTATWRMKHGLETLKKFLNAV